MLLAVNPGIYSFKADSQSQPVGPFIFPPGISVEETTALPRSWSADTTFLTSTGTTDTAKLEHNYPGFNGLDMSNTRAIKVVVGDIVDKIYAFSIFSESLFASTSTPTVSSSFAVGPAAAAPVENGVGAPSQGEEANTRPAVAPQAQSHQISSGNDHGSRPTVQPHQSAPPNQGLWEWTTRVEFNKYELGASFSVPIFLGTVPEDPEEWLVSPNFVGACHAYVSSTVPHRANRQNQGGLEEGFVLLNKAIIQHAGLASLEPEVVEPYLSKQLNWRVQKSDGSVAELQSLEVSVFATPLTYPPGSQFPVPGEPRRYNRITYGRLGGSRHT